MLNIIFSDLVSLIKLQTELKKVKMSLFFFRLYSHFKENGKKLTQIRGHVKKMSSGFTINVHLFFSFGSNLLKISKKSLGNPVPDSELYQCYNFFKGAQAIYNKGFSSVKIHPISIILFCNKLL